MCAEAGGVTFLRISSRALLVCGFRCLVAFVVVEIFLEVVQERVIKRAGRVAVKRVR